MCFLAYFKNSPAQTRNKKNIIQVNKIEDVIGGGQVEELYRMAEDELKLIPKYAEWRMWETRDEHEAREQSTHCRERIILQLRLRNIAESFTQNTKERG